MKSIIIVEADGQRAEFNGDLAVELSIRDLFLRNFIKTS
jgi:hypothetical protein